MMTLAQVAWKLGELAREGGCRYDAHDMAVMCSQMADAVTANLSQPQPVAQGEAVHPVDAVWQALDKVSCPGVYMKIAAEAVAAAIATSTIPTGHRVVPEDLPRPMCDVLAWHLEESRQGRHFFVQHVWDKLLAASPSAGGV